MKSLGNKADVAQRQRIARRQSSTDFLDHASEWRRIFAEFWGTFLLVVVAAGGEVVASRSGGTVTPGYEGGCARTYGNGHHLFHGRSERSSFKPGGYLGLRGSAELSVEPSAGLRPGTSSRWCLDGAFPPRHVRYGRCPWGDSARQWHRQRKSIGDGSTPDNWVGEHNPRHGFRSTQHRHQWCNRGGRIYCPGRTLDLVRGDFGTTWIYLVGPVIGALIGVIFEWMLKGNPTTAGAIAAQGARDGDDSTNA